MKPLPYWLWPWCAFLFLLPFEELIGATALEVPFKLLGLGAALLLALLPGRAAPGGGRLVAVALLFLALCASFFFSVVPELSRTVLVPLGLMFGVYALAAPVRLAAEEFAATLRAWFRGGSLAAVCTLAAFASGVADEDGRAYLGWGAIETDPNILVAQLVLPFAIGLGWLARGERRLEAGAGLALMTLATAATQSRGGIIACLAMVVACLLWCRRFLLLGALGAGLGGLYVTCLPMLGRLANEAQTGSGRTEIWAVGWDFIGRYWATGVGLGGFPTLALGASTLYFPWATHNTYLQVFVETGLAGVLAFALVGWTHLRFRSAGPAAAALRLGALGLLLSAFFLHLLAYKLFWLVLTVFAQAARTAPHGAFEPAAPHFAEGSPVR